MAKRLLAVLLALTMPFLMASAVVWVNDGGNGWGTGESVEAADMNAIATAVNDNDSRLDNLGTCTASPCDLTAATTVNGASIQTGTDDDVPDAGDFGAATDLDANGAVASGITRDTESTEECVNGGLSSPNNTDRVVPGRPWAVTITRLSCTVGGTTPSITLALEECDTAGANCADGGISLTCDGGIDHDTTFTDAAFDAGDGWNFNTGAASGTVTYLAWVVCYDRQVVQ